MSSILMACVPAHGHVTPMSAVAKGFVERGDDVRFITGSRFADRISATGATHIPLPPEADYDETFFNTLPERAKLKGVKAVAFDLEHVFARPAKAQYDAIMAALAVRARRCRARRPGCHRWHDTHRPSALRPTARCRLRHHPASATQSRYSALRYRTTAGALVQQTPQRCAGRSQSSVSSPTSTGSATSSTGGARPRPAVFSDRLAGSGRCRRAVHCPGVRVPALGCPGTASISSGR